MPDSKQTVHVIICAAGVGSRFGTNTPKQFCNMRGRPVLMHTIDAFRQALPDCDITLVISKPMESLWESQCHQCNYVSPRVIYGGKTRWESVQNAIKALKSSDEDAVLIHDGARPLVTAEVINNVLRDMQGHDGAIPTVPVTDSIRRTQTDGLSKPVDRSSLRAVQTPQGFAYRLLKKAYSRPYQATFTDDASVVDAIGYTDITLTQGDPHNIKITNPDDIKIAELFVK